MRYTIIYFYIASCIILLSTCTKKDTSQEQKIVLFPERMVTSEGIIVTPEKGYIHVPSNRSSAVTSTLAIEFFRFKGVKGTEKNTPTFRLYGGPGFRGLLNSRWDEPGFYKNEIEPFLSIGDFVIIGQRGIGSSLPDTQCGIIDRGLTKESRTKAIAEGCESCKALWENRGVDLSGINIVEAAADVNDVRKALGYEKINIWGSSFGSHWTMAVMRYYPEVVQRVLLRGLEGPNHTYDMPSYILNSLKKMAKAAEISPELQAHIPEGGLIKALEAVIKRLEEKTEEVEIIVDGEMKTIEVNAEMVKSLALGYTNRVSSRKGMPTWPSDIIRLYNGDYAGLALVSYYLNTYYILPEASYFLLDCASGITPERMKEIENDSANALLGNVVDEYVDGCPTWNIDLGNEFRKNFKTDIPTLMVHGTWDVSTPYENATELAPYFKNGKLITVIGGSHWSESESFEEFPGFRDEVLQFLLEGDMNDIPDSLTLKPINWIIP